MISTATVSNKPLQVYRSVHTQGFLPIIANDDMDFRLLVEAAVRAGCSTLEYTLRCKNAAAELQWIRENHPELHVLVGSVIDGDSLVEKARVHHPQLLTLQELADFGVHGFISMFGFREETLRRLSSTHLMIAPAYTLNEAHRGLLAGAHFCKILGPNLDMLKLFSAAPTFGMIPAMVTGGMDLANTALAIKTGAVLVGTGFELMLRPHGAVSTVQDIANVIAEYLEVTQKARAEILPKSDQCSHASIGEWLETISHHHPF